MANTPPLLNQRMAKSEHEVDLPDSDESTGIKVPPSTIAGIIRQLGPGLIVAGSIVGSGELIATTVTGAKAGFWLLWLILIGCVIKVLVQVELGRYSLATGKTAMDGFDDVPGPRIKNHGNWLIWYWFIMFVASIAQLGGIAGGVGQALSISVPVTQYGKDFNTFAEAETKTIVGATSVGDFASYLDETDSDVEIEFRDQYFLPMLDAQVKIREQHEDNFDREPFEKLLKYSKSERFSPLLYEIHRLSTESTALSKEVLEEDNADSRSELEDQLSDLKKQKSSIVAKFPSLENHVDTFGQLSKPMSDPMDDEIWAAIVIFITILLLVVGRFTLIQNFSTALVALFTLITVVNIFLLQSNAEWGFSLNDVMSGLQFRLPPGADNGVSIALMTFGIIGVGASELVMYPYWCQEKGYGRYVGPNDGSEEWISRAKGWMRVMRWDAWCSMLVYTFSTVAFYLLGASILWRTGLLPEGNDTIRYLAVMYEPVFGSIAQGVFLFGAIAVLYSTIFVSFAAHARTFSDALRVIGFAKRESYRKLIVFFSVFFPVCSILIYIFYPRPVELVLISGLMQALMLPMLAGASIFYRYYRIDKRLQPGIFWDVFLWISAIGMLVAGLWLGWSKISG